MLPGWSLAGGVMSAGGGSEGLAFYRWDDAKQGGGRVGSREDHECFQYLPQSCPQLAV